MYLRSWSQENVTEFEPVSDGPTLFCLSLKSWPFYLMSYGHLRIKRMTCSNILASSLERVVLSCNMKNYHRRDTAYKKVLIHTYIK